jgi:hypothetical protein
VIPQNIIDRPPSAELKPDQTDQDSLPPYEVLDAIIAGLHGARPVAARDHRRRLAEADVRRVVGMLQAQRIQAPPGAGRHPRHPARLRQGLALSDNIATRTNSEREERNASRRTPVMKKIEAIIKPFKLDEVREACPRSASPA